MVFYLRWQELFFPASPRLGEHVGSLNCVLGLGPYKAVSCGFKRQASAWRSGSGRLVDIRNSSCSFEASLWYGPLIGNVIVGENSYSLPHLPSQAA